MNRPIKTSRGITLIMLASVAAAVLIVFLAKKGEIEMKKITDSISPDERSISRLATAEVEKENGSDTDEWKLVSGNPEDICTIPVYEGSARIRGWYVYGEGYGKKKEWLLRISQADRAKLPLFETNRAHKDFHLRVKLENVSDELEEKLKKASEENPTEIEISRYLAHCEGVSLAKIRLAENK